MAILLLPLVFLTLLILFSIKKGNNESINIKEAFVVTSLLISFLIVVYTESLSFFNQISHISFVILWSITLIISSFFLFLHLKDSKIDIKKIFFKNIESVKKLSYKKKFLILIFFVIFIGIFIIALTPTVNYDSYSYHLARVYHWLINKNVNFYLTNNVRQLYLSPFAEYAILNIQLLSKGILFNNFVQLFSFLNSILLISLLADFFNLKRLLPIILALTIPMALMQAVTAQNDLVVSFFVLSFVYWGFVLIQKAKFDVKIIVLLSLGFALGIFTKATFYLFAFPFSIIFGFFFIKIFKLKAFVIPVIMVLVTVFVNGIFISRNFSAFDSFMGPKKNTHYYIESTNSKPSIKVMLSNSLKNLSLHFVVNNEKWNTNLFNVTTSLNDIIEVPIDSSQTNFMNMKFELKYFGNMDTIGNFILITLFLISFPLMFVFRKKSPLLLKVYFFATFSTYLLFSLVLKWQPWQTRLDLPFFFLSIPVIVFVLENLNFKWLTFLVSTISIIFALEIVFVGTPYRQIIGKDSILNSKNVLYTLDSEGAQKTEKALEKYKIEKVGLFLHANFPEWEFWLASPNRRFEYILFSSDFKNKFFVNEDFSYRAVILDNLLLPLIKSLNILDDKDILEKIELSNNTMLVIYNTDKYRLYPL